MWRTIFDISKFIEDIKDFKLFFINSTVNKETVVHFYVLLQNEN